MNFGNTDEFRRSHNTSVDSPSRDVKLDAVLGHLLGRHYLLDAPDGFGDSRPLVTVVEDHIRMRPVAWIGGAVDEVLIVRKDGSVVLDGVAPYLRVVGSRSQRLDVTDEFDVERIVRRQSIVDLTTGVLIE